MPHHIVEHDKLTWMTKSLLWYLLSRPLDWVTYRSQLAKVYKGDVKGNGKDAIDRCFKELMDFGFIIYTAKDEKTGKFIHRYDVYPEPQTDKITKIKEKIPKRVKPEMASTSQGLNYPQQSNDSLPRTKKKNNVSTMPSSKDDKRKEFPKQKNPKRFVANLTPDQRKVHDQIVKHKPMTGEAPDSNSVCAWFLDTKNHGYSYQQVSDAFLIYRQDSDEARLNGRSINNMGGYILSAMKLKRVPKNAAFEFNRQLAERLCKSVDEMEVLSHYVRYNLDLDSDTIPFSLPKATFSSLLESKIRSLQERYV
jgi:hypothetical protein